MVKNRKEDIKRDPETIGKKWGQEKIESGKKWGRAKNGVRQKTESGIKRDLEITVPK